MRSLRTRAARSEGTAPADSEADASDNGRQHPARYGQNDHPIALTRKNALFAGHDKGAEGWATCASLIETCKLNNVDPLAWMTDVLTKLVNRWPNSRIGELMPWAWAAAQTKPGAIIEAA